MKCKKHGEVGEPLSTGKCVMCEREEIGQHGLEMLAVILDLTSYGKSSIKHDEVIKEYLKRKHIKQVGFLK